MSVTAPRRGLASTERYRDAVGQYAEGVAVITAAIGEDAVGTAASTVASLSVDPPMILIGIDRECATGRAIDRSGEFAVNFLADDQSDLAELFIRGEGQSPLERCLVRIECQVTERMTSASHLVFIGLAQAVDASAGTPLTSYRGRFHRLEPISHPG